MRYYKQQYTHQPISCLGLILLGLLAGNIFMGCHAPQATNVQGKGKNSTCGSVMLTPIHLKQLFGDVQLVHLEIGQMVISVMDVKGQEKAMNLKSQTKKQSASSQLSIQLGKSLYNHPIRQLITKFLRSSSRYLILPIKM